MSEFHLFTDIFTDKNGFLFELDARIKMGFTFICLFLVLLSNKIITGLAVFAGCFLILALNKIPLRIMLKRIFAPLMFASVILVLQALHGGNHSLASFHLLNTRFILYKEGAARGLLITSRILGASSLLMLLGVTTPVHQIFLAGKALKIPAKMAEVGLLTYRYIFVLIDKASTMKNAQTTRLGYSKFRLSLSSFSNLAGMLFIHSYDQSKNISDAMTVRGYKGGPVSGKLDKIDLKNNLSVFLAMLLVVLTLAATIIF